MIKNNLSFPIIKETKQLTKSSQTQLKCREKIELQNQRKCALKVSAVVMGFLLASVALSKGVEALNNRLVCKEWREKLDILDWEEYSTFTNAAWRKWEYKWNAEVNCKLSPEFDFCQGANDPPSWVNYPPQDNLPVDWRIVDPDWCDTEEGQRWTFWTRHPGMPLTCFSRIANKTRVIFEEAKANLSAAIENQPLGCLLKWLRLRDTMDYSDLYRNY